MTRVNDSRGVQIGSGNVQINLFPGEQPRGPAVAGSIPQPPPAFQPREDLMARLRAAGPGVCVVRAMTGLRGVGKTQLAAAYARECLNNGWRLVAWINAEDTPTILSGLASVADRIGIDRPGTPLETIAVEVRNRLEADGERCLVVFDDVTDPDSIRPYIPAAGKSQVVITSTQSSALSLGTPAQVDVFTEQESLDFLAERTGLRDPAGATAVAKELSCLPLALAQAAAVIRSQHLTYSVYLERLRSKSARDYLKPSKEDPYPRGAAEAILLSIETVSATEETALCTDLLAVIALLSPDGVSRGLLYLGSQDVFGADAEAIDEALARLADSSLLTLGGGDETNPTVTAHRLVMRVIRECRAQTTVLMVLGAMAGDMVIALLEAGAQSLGEPWQHRSAARALVQQVTALNDHMTLRDWPALLDRRAWALRCLLSLGDSAEQALALGVPLLADWSRAFGEDHPSTRVLQSNLAHAYRAAGRLGEAILLLERTLAGQAGVEDHRELLGLELELAGAYLVAGRVAEAIPLLESTLADFERVLSEDHPDTVTTRGTLASAYRAAGRVGEAVQLYERTVADSVRLLGEEHPETLGARNNLALGYREAGRADEAMSLLEQTLADCVRALGWDHPDTLRTQNNVGAEYLAAGRVGEAIPVLERALAGLERVLGSQHPTTVIARENLTRARGQAGLQSG